MHYRPVKDGIEKNIKYVTYLEVEPPEQLKEFVHCFWELKTQKALPEDFKYLIIPDACVNILFDQINLDVSAVTAIQLKSITLNLGKNFHYIGIQLLPGVWRGNPDEIKGELVDKSYSGSLNLIEINKKMENLSFSNQQQILSKFLEKFIEDKLLVSDPVVTKILLKFDEINSVSDMATKTNLSTRQLQRKIKQITGFSPHDFLKILRLQQSFAQNYQSYYTDQAHYIHSFRKITGYTPLRYLKKFDV